MLVLIIALILINIQLIDGFCRLYENNDYNVLIHSPDNKNLLLVVEGFYWLVNESSNNELKFVSSEIEHYGKSDALTGISILFSVGLTQTLVNENGKNRTVTDFVGFHEVRHRIE